METRTMCTHRSIFSRGVRGLKLYTSPLMTVSAGSSIVCNALAKFLTLNAYTNIARIITTSVTISNNIYVQSAHFDE